MHLPAGLRGPSENQAAGDELRDDGGTKATRSCEQSGLSVSFSILSHYFATSSASFHTLGLDYFQSAVPKTTPKKQQQQPQVLDQSKGAAPVIQSRREDSKL